MSANGPPPFSSLVASRCRVRQGERRGLARSGGRLADEIPAQKQGRNRLTLDRRRFLVTQVRQCRQQAKVEAQR